MTLPSLILGFMIALLIGTVFHVLRGGGLGKLTLYLILSLAGFAGGHFLGIWRGWIFLPIGPLDAGPAIVGSLVFLGFGDWLSHIEIKPDDNSQV